MAIFQSPKNIFQRPNFPGKSLKFRRRSDFGQISDSEIWKFRARKIAIPYPQPFHTPTRLPLIQCTTQNLQEDHGMYPQRCHDLSLVHRLARLSACPLATPLAKRILCNWPNRHHTEQKTQNTETLLLELLRCTPPHWKCIHLSYARVSQGLTFSEMHAVLCEESLCLLARPLTLAKIHELSVGPHHQVPRQHYLSQNPGNPDTAPHKHYATKTQITYSQPESTQ